MTDQYMLLFTIGPVQSFIAQARKTRDLWLGSYLLSMLMEVAMEGMKEQLVFPAEPTLSGKVPDLPNRYIAIFNDPEQAQQSVKDSIKRIQKRWEEICDDIWDKIFVRAQRQSSDILKIDEAKKIWDRQVAPNRFFEMFWVIVAGDEDPELYHKWLGKTQTALAARKRLRHVQPETLEEEVELGEKSTISGEREALRDEGERRDDVRKFWRQLTESGKHTIRDINKNGEERLDAIDTVKRFAYLSHALEEKQVDAYFPSTSTVATASFIERLLRVITADQSSRITNALQPWLDVTYRLFPDAPIENIPYLFALAQGDPKGILRRDGDCYFLETFTPRRLEKDYTVPQTRSRDIASRGQQALGTLLRETDALGITRPTPYYAMIQMDGDKMGELLSGVEDKDEHKDISSALSKFSRGEKGNQAGTISARTIVEESYPGRLIYAGGDDVFALAPLARDSAEADEPLIVLQLVDRLQQRYQEMVIPAVQDEERKKRVTASTGVTIAHHFTSLSYVRRTSKEAETLAKKVYGRDSLVVTVLRRSGEQTRVGCRWRYETQNKDGQSSVLDPIDIFSQFYTLFKENKLSPKCVYLLLEEVPALVHPSLFLEQDPDKSMSDEKWKGMSEDERAMQVSEIKRVLRRQRSSKDDLSDARTEELARLLVELATAMDKDTRKSNEDKKQVAPQEKTRAVELYAEERRYGLVEVLGWLQVMVFLTRKEQE